MLLRRVLVLLLIGLATAATGPVASLASRANYPVRKGRCILAPRVLRLIDEGLKRNLSVLWPVYAVRSRDYNHVYMVSARVALASASHVTRSTPVVTATWAVGTLDGQGPIFSVDHVAPLVSDWGKLPHGSLLDDGVFQSRRCVGG